MKKIAIGGMIGVGKSTLVKNLSSYNDIKCLDEFSESEELFSILLDALYRKVPNSELALQFYFLAHHHRNVEEFVKKHTDKYDFLIFDRYLFEHYYFASLNVKHDEFIKYYLPHYATTLATSLNSMPDLYVLLNASWDNIKSRILKRGRKEEIDNFSSNEDYFKKLQDHYTDGVIKILEIYKIPYKILDANCDDKDLVNNFLDLMKKL